VNLTMRHVCRLTPQGRAPESGAWISVCAAKDSGRDAVAKGAVG